MPLDDEKLKKVALPEKPNVKQAFTVDTACGLGTGASLAAGFCWWDKALYKALVERIPVRTALGNMATEAIDMRSYKPLFEGSLQSMAQRSFSWGAYYIAQNQGKTYLYPYLMNRGWTESQAQFAVGTAAGSISGALTNPLSTIKYYLWKNKGNTFASSTANMWRAGGIKPFLKGITVTVDRDIVFGSIYEVARNAFASKLKQHDIPVNKKTKFVSNMFAASLATMGSAPFNYARTMIYDTPPTEKPKRTHTILYGLWKEVRKEKGILAQLKLAKDRLRVGPGTLRVAVGMSAGQLVFDGSSSAVNAMLKDPNSLLNSVVTKKSNKP